MGALSIVALLLGVAGAVARPWRAPPWAVPSALAVVVMVIGALSPAAAGLALRPLVDPVAFLLAAVPLAVLLDRTGYFAVVAEQLVQRGRGVGGLWVMAAAVTTVLNLDTAVVLLTPLYVNVARRSGRDPLTLALQPVLLACLASAALPVSNLTNLIAQSATGASTVQFLAHLGLPSLAATGVGWLLYRRRLARPAPAGADVGGRSDAVAVVAAGRAGAAPAGSERRVVVGGTAVVAGALLGFTVGPAVGVAPWQVALAADVALVTWRRQVPWRDVPVATALVALSLGLLAAGAATHLPLGRVLAGTGILAQARVAGTMALAANVANNLPALLVALPSLGGRSGPTLWSVLIGVDMGPVLLVTGSLASLLWLDALGRLGVAARARDFTMAGLQIGLPAAAAGAAVHLALVGVGLT